MISNIVTSLGRFVEASNVGEKDGRIGCRHVEVDVKQGTSRVVGIVKIEPALEAEFELHSGYLGPTIMAQ